MKILGSLSNLDQGELIVLHEVDATKFGGAVYRFHDGLGQDLAEVIWCGQRYTYWPVEVEEIRIEGDRPSRPRLRIGNHAGAVTKLCTDYQDLVGSIYTLRTTKACFLDSANFSGWRGYAVALEGRSSLSGTFSSPCQSVLIEVEHPSDPEGSTECRAVTLQGQQPLVVGFQAGQLFMSCGASRVNLAPAAVGQKFTITLAVDAALGQVFGLINEAAYTLPGVTPAPWTGLVLGGGGNQGVRFRTVAARSVPFTLQDLRAHAESDLINNPTAHYRFSQGSLKDDISQVPLNVVDAEVTIRDDYYYSRYGLSKHSVKLQDSLGAVYLVDWFKVNPTASIYEEFPAERYRIVRKASETPMEITFELAPLHDVRGIKLPLRLVTENVCLHTYRDEYCGYSGPPRDVGGTEIVIPEAATAEQRAALLAKDECSHDKRGCMARFGRVLPIGCFLGAGRVKR